MRIIRFIDADGRTHYGEEHRSGSVTHLKGSLISGFERTTESALVEKILAPLEPADIICIGRNYTTGSRAPDADRALSPTDAALEVFLKPSTAIQNPGDPILMPWFDDLDPQLDCEGELAIVIGRTARNVSESEAVDHVFGYTIANDVTARAFQTSTGPPIWMRGKGFDTFCPIGPAIVTKDEIRDPQSLPIRTIINGRTVREGNTCDMICTVPRLIAALSRHMTLRPGSLILTGAPPAHAFSPLQPGDVAVVEIDQLGSLRNPIASGHSRLH